MNSPFLTLGHDFSGGIGYYRSSLLGGYGARTHGVYQHLTLNGNTFYFVFPFLPSDQCRCRLQLCDDAGQADAVNITMLYAISRQCRQKSMRSVWPRFISFTRAMLRHADAVRFISFMRESRVMPMLSASSCSRGKCRHKSMLSASADNASPHS